MKLSQIINIRFSFDLPGVPTPPSLIRCHQVHSATVVTVKENNEDAVSSIKADGLITSNKCTIGVQTADCLPVLFSSTDGKRIAAVHAGWKGLLSGILVNTVDLFKAEGVDPKTLVVAIGPAIGPCCFEAHHDLIDLFEDKWGHLWEGATVKPWQFEQPASQKLGRSQAMPSSNNIWVDLIKIARLQLEANQVNSENIESEPSCTYCGPDQRASFRRATHEGKTAARQWAWIQIVNESELLDLSQ